MPPQWLIFELGHVTICQHTLGPGLAKGAHSGVSLAEMAEVGSVVVVGEMEAHHHHFGSYIGQDRSIQPSDVPAHCASAQLPTTSLWGAWHGAQVQEGHRHGCRRPPERGFAD